jgi:hypothetical protein
MVQGEFLRRTKVNPYFCPEQSPENRGQSPSILGGNDYEKSAGRSPSIFGGKYDEKTRA